MARARIDRPLLGAAIWLALVLALTFVARPAMAQDAAEVAQAREDFAQGADLANDAQWGAALASFERSAKVRPHAWTTYNIGVCERALGQYVRARRTFARALDERRPDADLPEATAADTKRLIAEIDRIVATLDVTLEPGDASITVDGQALEVATPGDRPTLVASTLPASAGKPPPAPRFLLVLDPGAHVFLIAREGFANAVHTETARPGERRALRLAVERLPATMRISSNEKDAVVMIDGLDVGIAPVQVQRPPGAHQVLVRKPGFDPVRGLGEAEGGAARRSAAPLKAHKPSVLTRWWFWSAAAVVIAGAAVTTYAATRPDPERPALDGGGLGWVVKAP